MLGWLAVRVAASRVFEAGTAVHPTRWAVASVALGVVGGIGAAAVAAHGVGRQHVAELLRRVPGAAAGRRAGIAEGGLLALVLAGVVQLVVTRDETPGPVAMAAPGMIALGGALLGARALRLLARRRAARSMETGRPAAVLGWAGVLRRAGVARTTGVLTAAIALLLVGVQAWSVAGRERAVRATAENGAAVVLSAQATSPRALLDAVRAVDPGGEHAMARRAAARRRHEPHGAGRGRLPRGPRALVRPPASRRPGRDAASGPAGLRAARARGGGGRPGRRVADEPLAGHRLRHGRAAALGQRGGQRRGRHVVGWSCPSATCSAGRTRTGPTSPSGAQAAAGSSGWR